MPNTNELARELDDALADDTEDISSEPTAPDTRDQADRRARSYRRVLSDIDDLNELCDERITEINSWRSLRLSPLVARAEWLKASLVAFAKVRKAVTGGAGAAHSEKSQRFTSGVEVKLTPAQGSLVVLDEAAFMEWAKANAPDLIVTPPVPAPTIAKVETKKRFALSPNSKPIGDEDEIEFVTADGDVVPGIVLRRATDDGATVAIKPVDEPTGVEV